MEIRSFCSLPATLLRFRPRDGQLAIAVICKATYRLVPGVASLAVEQDPLQIGEYHYNNDSTQSVERPNDLVPFKPRAEVLVVGSAFVPQRRSSRLLSVRLIVGEIDKSLDVFCPRTLNQDGSIREGTSWTSMPLRYERAAGGVDTWNPVGMSASRESGFGTRELPQIVPAGFFAADPNQTIPPDGFGPLSARWPIRFEKLGARAGAFSEDRLEGQVLGSDFDLGFFQAAPQDQQLDSLRPDERIVLENMHREHSRLVTSLPGLLPIAFLRSPSNAPVQIVLRPDTLWIDTDRSVCTVTFRGQVSVTSFEQPGTVFVLLQEPGQVVTWADVQSKLAAEVHSGSMVSAHAARPQYDPDTTTDIDIGSLRGSRPAVPFGAQVPRPAISPKVATNTRDDDDEKGTLVYDLNALRARAGGPTSASGHESTKVMNTSALLGGKPAMPFVSSPASPAAPNSPVPPMMAPPPVPPIATAPVMPKSPPTGLSFGVPPAPPSRVSVPNPEAAPTAPPLAVLRRSPTFTGLAPAPELARPASVAALAVFAESPSPVRSMEPPKTIGEMHVKGKPPAGYEGVLAASNAAADPQPADVMPAVRPADKPVSDDQKAGGGEDIEVIWYEASYLPRVRKHPQWASLCKPAPKPGPVQRGQAPAPPPSPQALEEIADADVFAILAQGAPTREQDVAPGRKGGKDREAALYLLSGTISFPLDEIELLKATSRAAAPLATSDKKLKEVLDMVEGVLKMPLEGAPELVQSFIVRVREAWTNANKMLPPDYLVSHAERTLLNQRQYQKRELLDDEWIRSLYTSSPDAVPIPAYIPAKLAKRLPLFRQVSARLIVEALSQQDMYESHPIALRVVALARGLAVQEAPARGRR